MTSLTLEILYSTKQRLEKIQNLVFYIFQVTYKTVLVLLQMKDEENMYSC